MLIIDSLGYLCSICDGNIKWKKPEPEEHKQSLDWTEFVFLLLPRTPSAQFKTYYETEQHSKCCMLQCTYKQVKFMAARKKY